MTGTRELAVEIRDLAYRIDGLSVLADIDIVVERGQIAGVVGMSGCGKTSLLRCIAGLVRPTGGSVRIEGREMVGLGERRLADMRRRVGMIFQYAALFDSLTVYENVAFGLRYNTKYREPEIRRIVAEKLALVGMSGTEQMMPSSLSGGMQKRVGMARALAMEPALLLYDEPTSGLDPIMTRAISELIVAMRDRLGVTSIVVTHDMGTVLSTCDIVGLLHQGRMVQIASPERFRESSNPMVRQFVAGSLEGPISIGEGAEPVRKE
jgi:phospholipid/cholesterol/gamma-HCH transport system ATP-binding protein